MLFLPFVSGAGTPAAAAQRLPEKRPYPLPPDTSRPIKPPVYRRAWLCVVALRDFKESNVVTLNVHLVVYMTEG